MKPWKIIFWLIITLVIALAIFLILLSPKAKADQNPGTNIDSLDKWAWNDVIGWINFHDTHTVKVENDKLTGYASSDVGDIYLHCETTGNCGTTDNYGVTNNNGTLSGWAWNETIGWISFDCTQTNNCSFPYQVTINQTNGDFSGYAWNEIVGWISFNCNQTNHGGSNQCPPDYKVKADWQVQAAFGELESSIFDLNVEGILNSIIWQGEPRDGSVEFQIAVSNCENGATNPPACDNGSWTYRGPIGSSHFVGLNNQSIVISPQDRAWIKNNRYLRYKVFLTSGTDSPIITDIILNWSK